MVTSIIYNISKTWIKKITSGPVLRSTDKEGLQNLADTVRSCKETLEAMGMLYEVDTRRIMVNIIEQLPLYI